MLSVRVSVSVEQKFVSIFSVFDALVPLFVSFSSMDVTAAAAEHAGEMVKDELAEKCQKLFQAFLEE